MLNHSPLLRALAAGFALVFVLSCASTDLAQSGRRVRKSTPASVSTPEPTPTPTPNASSEKPKPRLTFLVGLDGSDGSANIPLYAYEGVLRSLADRLAFSVGQLKYRPRYVVLDAVRGGKEEKEVTFCCTAPNTFSGRPNLRRPLTLARHQQQKPATLPGNVYREAYRNKRVGLPTPSTNGDYYLNQAARGVAEKILDYFHKHLTKAEP